MSVDISFALKCCDILVHIVVDKSANDETSILPFSVELLAGYSPDYHSPGYHSPSVELPGTRYDIPLIVLKLNLIIFFLVLSHYWHLTHLPLMLHLCVCVLGQHWFRKRLVAYSAQSHYLNLCWVIDNWTLRIKLELKFKQSTKLFIHENVSGITVCYRVAILSRGRWVNIAPLDKNLNLYQNINSSLNEMHKC